MKVAEPTIERLVQYHRLLEMLREEGHRVVSSRQMGDLLGFKASQVRKDLSYFGEIGKRGVGYHVGKLSDHIMEILSPPRVWNLALAGVGNLGAALLSNSAFSNSKMVFTALFDVDAEKIGREYAGVTVSDVRDMPSIMKERGVEVLVLTVPARAAQACVDLALSSGVLKGVLAFSQSSLVLPDDILVFRVDFMAELEKLLFFLKQREENPQGS